MLDDIFRPRTNEYKIYLYRSDEDILKAVENTSFDIIFLDIDIPVTDGKDTAQGLRKLSKNKFKPVFISDHCEEVFSTFRYNIESFIPKNKIDIFLENEVTRIIDIINEQQKERISFGFKYKLTNYKFEKIKKQFCKYDFADIHRTCFVNLAFIALAILNFSDRISIIIGSAAYAFHVIIASKFIPADLTAIIRHDNIYHLFTLNNFKIFLEFTSQIIILYYLSIKNFRRINNNSRAFSILTLDFIFISSLLITAAFVTLYPTAISYNLIMLLFLILSTALLVINFLILNLYARLKISCSSSTYLRRQPLRMKLTTACLLSPIFWTTR